MALIRCGGNASVNDGLITMAGDGTPSTNTDNCSITVTSLGFASIILNDKYSTITSNTNGSIVVSDGTTATSLSLVANTPLNVSGYKNAIAWINTGATWSLALN